jgi:hypothetical protein
MEVLLAAAVVVPEVLGVLLETQVMAELEFHPQLLVQLFIMVAEEQVQVGFQVLSLVATEEVEMAVVMLVVLLVQTILVAVAVAVAIKMATVEMAAREL